MKQPFLTQRPGMYARAFGQIQDPQSENINIWDDEYKRLWYLMDSIFDEAFWSKTYSNHDDILRTGIDSIQNFFSDHCDLNHTYTRSSGLKLWKWEDTRSIMIKWWNHACSVLKDIVVCIWGEGREKQVKNAQQYVATLAHMHLTTETQFLAFQDRLLNGESISIDEMRAKGVYSLIDSEISEFPKLWCPAWFFSETKVGKKLFWWYVESYNISVTPDRERNWKCPYFLVMTVLWKIKTLFAI